MTDVADAMLDARNARDTRPADRRPRQEHRGVQCNFISAVENWRTFYSRKAARLRPGKSLKAKGVRHIVLFGLRAFFSLKVTVDVHDDVGGTGGKTGPDGQVAGGAEIDDRAVGAGLAGA